MMVLDAAAPHPKMNVMNSDNVELKLNHGEENL